MKALAALTIAALLLAGFFGVAEIASAHDIVRCSAPGQHASNGEVEKCANQLEVELLDWCADNGGARQYDDVLKPSCNLHSDDASVFNARKTACADAGYAVESGSFCVHNSRSSCAHRNNGNAVYVLGPTGHSCQCRIGSSGDPDAGTCGCPVETSMNNDGICVCDNTLFIRKDGKCERCERGEITLNGRCVTRWEKCAMTEGWTYSPAGGTCDADTAVMHDVAGGDSSYRTRRHCHISDDNSFYRCSSIFGPNLDFPPGNIPLAYVFNCDTHPTDRRRRNRRGLVPASDSAMATTECKCASPNNTHLGQGTLPPREITTTISFIDPGFCYPEFPRERDLNNLDVMLNIFQEELCHFFSGGENDARFRVCNGMDKANTYCLLNNTRTSRKNFDCVGLFRHVRTCNAEFNRPAVNPFLCGGECEDGEIAYGKDCVPR